MRKPTAGFTMVEVIAAIGIILVIAVVASPVISSAKKSARLRTCESNLRQLHVAISLYRQQWDGDGVFGTSFEMGLPPSFAADRIPELLSLRCAEAGNEIFSVHGVHYYTYWLEPDLDRLHPKWKDYSVAHQGNSIFVSDMNHNPKDKPLLEGDYITRSGVGITENGTLLRRRKRGDWIIRTWWNNP